jgi:RNA polymerase sigma factor (sigma-70 family)
LMSSVVKMIDKGQTSHDLSAGKTIVLEEVARQRAVDAVTLDFSTFYQDYKHKVYGTVQHVVGPTSELDDIVQTVFLEIFRSLKNYKGNAQLSTWVYRVAVNVALQHIRKKKRSRVYLFFTEDERQRSQPGDDPRSRYEHRERVTRLYRLVDKLSEKKRIVFVLHEIEGMTVERIAGVCEIPPNTVRSRLIAARAELTRRMRKAGMMESENAV